MFDGRSSPQFFFAPIQLRLVLAGVSIAKRDREREGCRWIPASDEHCIMFNKLGLGLQYHPRTNPPEQPPQAFGREESTEVPLLA